MRYRNNELGLVLGLGLGSGCDTSSVQVVQFLQGTPLMLCSRYDHDNPSSWFQHRILLLAVFT